MNKKFCVALVIATMVVIVAGAHAAESSKDILKEIVKAAVAPAETILGKSTALETVVVTPTKMGESLASTSSSVSVVSSEEFDREKINTAKEVLMDEVGLEVVQAGSFQGQTSLFTRGGNSNQTLILIDGVKAYDPISPNGAFNMAHLTLDNVDTIEIVRGPQSVLYGSDAMSGVVSIMSKKAETPYVNATFSGGSFNTYNETFEMGAATHGFHYSLSASRLDTKGISQAQAKKNCQETDPYDRTSVAGRVDYDINEYGSIGATFRYIKAHYDMDQGSDADDDNASAISTDNFFTLFGNYNVTPWWAQTLKLGWMQTKRLTYDEDSPGFEFTRRKDFGQYFKLDYENTLEITRHDSLLIGYSYTEELGDSYNYYKDWTGAMVLADMPKVFSRESDFYIENRFNYEDRLTLTQGLRVGHHSTAGTFETYRMDGSYLFPTATKVRGSWSTGFRAPSLYQLYAPATPFVFGGGNPALQPEKSDSYEFGADQFLFVDKIKASITYFHTLYKNLIDSPYDPATWFSGQYVNIGKSQVHGIEFNFKVKPVKRIDVESGFTFLKPWDFSNDQELPRRASQMMYMKCFWQATDAFSMDLKVRYEGPRSDNLNTFGNTYKVKGFTVVDFVANYDLTKNFSLFGRIDNLFNTYYEEVRGYTMSPFAAYGGVKAKF